MAQLGIPTAKFTRPVEDPSFSQMDTALRYGIFLEISHEGDYIMACHEDKFANDHIYDQGNVLLPSVLRTTIAEFLPNLILWANNERKLISSTIPGSDSINFDDLMLTYERFRFPSLFGDPFRVDICGQFYEDERVRLAYQALLHKAFDDIASDPEFPLLRFKYDKPDKFWTSD